MADNERGRVSGLTRDERRLKAKLNNKRILKGVIAGLFGAAMLTKKGRHYVQMFFTAWWEMLRRSPYVHSEGGPDDGFLVIGHRGACSRYLENSIESFEAAIEEDGANGIETDLCLTKDGRVIIWHDWDPSEVRAVARSLGLETDVLYAPMPPPIGHPHRKPIHELTLDEVRDSHGYRTKTVMGSITGPQPVPSHILTLEEFMEWAVTKQKLKYVFFDMKTPANLPEIGRKMMEIMERIVQSYKPHFEHVYLTPYVPILKEFKAANPGTNYILDNDPPPGFILEPCKFTSVTGAIRFGNAYADTVHPKAVTFAPWTTFRRILRCDVRLRNRHNKLQRRTKRGVKVEKVIACSINEDYKAEVLIRLGVDGLMSDNPRWVREFAERMGKTLA